MKVFLSGQKSFGRECLLALLSAGHEITGVAIAPQKKQKDRMLGAALLNGVPVVTEAETLVSDMIPAGTELIVSAHSHWMISQKCLDKCPHGGIGFHPSLLPIHRGRDAVRWAVYMGDRITGCTVYRLTDKCDGGEILLQRPIFIKPGWDYHRLWREMFPIGIDMIVKAVGLIEAGKETYTEQDEDCATWEPSWDRERLRRNELLQLPAGGGEDICRDCEMECDTCTAQISDPETYYRR